MKFTIRDVLWLMALVAVAFGWLVDHGNQMQLAQDCEERNTRLTERLNEYAREIKRLDPSWVEVKSIP